MKHMMRDIVWSRHSTSTRFYMPIARISIEWCCRDRESDSLGLLQREAWRQRKRGRASMPIEVWSGWDGYQERNGADIETETTSPMIVMAMIWTESLLRAATFQSLFGQSRTDDRLEKWTTDHNKASSDQRYCVGVSLQRIFDTALGFAGSLRRAQFVLRFINVSRLLHTTFYASWGPCLNFGGSFLGSNHLNVHGHRSCDGCQYWKSYVQTYWKRSVTTNPYL